MTNCVCYDGVDAYVIKLILDWSNEDEAKNTAEMYMANAGMELLKLDRLYGVTLENIIAFSDYDDGEFKTIFNRFKEMYF